MIFSEDGKEEFPIKMDSRASYEQLTKLGFVSEGVYDLVRNADGSHTPQIS